MVTAPIQMATQIRIARPTDRLDQLLVFYRDGLGFEELYRFEDHEGFDGVMLGHRGAPYHLEFTHHRGHQVGRAPSQDHLIVFYLPDQGLWEKAVARMVSHGFPILAAYNPYWDRLGRTFEDADGYRIVLQGSDWG